MRVAGGGESRQLLPHKLVAEEQAGRVRRELVHDLAARGGGGRCQDEREQRRQGGMDTRSQHVVHPNQELCGRI
jgi:hypothetical protein